MVFPWSTCPRIEIIGWRIGIRIIKASINDQYNSSDAHIYKQLRAIIYLSAMDEKSAINLLLLFVAICIVINLAAISVFSDAKPDAVMNFMIPMACVQENSTYLLASPTNAKFCNRILDYAKNFDGNDFKEACDNLEGSDKDSCVAISSLYGKRVSDCTASLYNFDLEDALTSKESSVSNSEAKQACGRFN